MARTYVAYNIDSRGRFWLYGGYGISSGMGVFVIFPLNFYTTNIDELNSYSGRYLGERSFTK